MKLHKEDATPLDLVTHIIQIHIAVSINLAEAVARIIVSSLEEGGWLTYDEDATSQGEETS